MTSDKRIEARQIFQRIFLSSEQIYAVMELAKVSRAPDKFQINKILYMKCALREASFGHDLSEALGNIAKFLFSVTNSQFADNSASNILLC